MPTLWASGIEGSWDYLAMDLLGSSLHSLFWKSGKSTMDLRSVLCIGMQVVSLLVVHLSRFRFELKNRSLALPLGWVVGEIRVHARTRDPPS